MSLKDTKETQRLAFTVKDAVDAIGLSRSKLYAMMKEGTLRSVLVGGRRLIPVDALRALVDCPA